MKERKFIFFDIDGTLTNDNPGGDVLPSTKETLEKLRQRGHFVALATGRGQHYAYSFMEENGFSHMVSDGGNGITIDKKLIHLEPLNRDLALTLIAEMMQKGISFSIALDNTPTLYTYKDLPYYHPASKDTILLETFSDVEKIFKIFVKANALEEKNLKAIHTIGYIRYRDDNLIVEPLDKFRGIKKIVSYMNGSMDDVVVFGDGKNDITMMQQAAMSVAMGNAIDELKKIATFVTKNNKEDGIMYACKHFGWIDS